LALNNVKKIALKAPTSIVGAIYYNFDKKIHGCHKKIINKQTEMSGGQMEKGGSLEGGGYYGQLAGQNERRGREG
jgi:hypothetical protein